MIDNNGHSLSWDYSLLEQGRLVQQVNNLYSFPQMVSYVLVPFTSHQRLGFSYSLGVIKIGDPKRSLK